MANEKLAPVIIKKIKKGGDHGHHGGAWKIAYADFVTAMMAFFLLMWLLNATTQEQKRGIASYFDPINMGERKGGGEGVMAGKSLTSEEYTAESSMSAMTIKQSKPQEKGRGGQTVQSESTKTDEDAIAAASENEAANFESAKKEIENAVKDNPELKEWVGNLIIDETPEGLRIQIVDQQEKSMFPSGSAQMYDHTRKLLFQVSAVIGKLPNKLSISGHTDATPYNTKNYGNWELSSDRAHASRRVLGEAGLGDARFASVVGKEAKEPFIKGDPLSAQNRRISIVLLRQAPMKEVEAPSGKNHPVKKPA